jgi:hypothetical protein
MGMIGTGFGAALTASSMEPVVKIWDKIEDEQ